MTATALSDGTKIEAASVIRDLNLAMSWLHHPDRRNGVFDTQALDFTLSMPPT